MNENESEHSSEKTYEGVRILLFLELLFLWDHVVEGNNNKERIRERKSRSFLGREPSISICG